MKTRINSIWVLKSWFRQLVLKTLTQDRLFLMWTSRCSSLRTRRQCQVQWWSCRGATAPKSHSTLTKTTFCILKICSTSIQHPKWSTFGSQVRSILRNIYQGQCRCAAIAGVQVTRVSIALRNILCSTILISALRINWHGIIVAKRKNGTKWSDFRLGRIVWNGSSAARVDGTSELDMSRLLMRISL